MPSDKLLGLGCCLVDSVRVKTFLTTHACARPHFPFSHYPFSNQQSFFSFDGITSYSFPYLNGKEKGEGVLTALIATPIRTNKKEAN